MDILDALQAFVCFDQGSRDEAATEGREVASFAQRGGGTFEFRRRRRQRLVDGGGGGSESTSPAFSSPSASVCLATLAPKDAIVSVVLRACWFSNVALPKATA